MSPLPLPVRVAAGLAVTAVDQARRLPTQLATLPVTVVSRALQAGMRVQQHVTELAIKGDEAFALLRRTDENPPWARFDEDFAPQGDAQLATVLSGPGSGRSRDDRPAAAEVDEADVAQALSREPEPEPAAAPAPEPVSEPAPEPDRATAETPVGSSAGGSGPPPAMPGYDEYSLAQLRGKLRSLSAEQLEALLAHEQRHQDRAPFVTMLSNRITTVRTK